jgi:AMP deaminase
MYSSVLVLTPHRIDRYTRAAQSGSHDLTSSNLQSEVPQTPKSLQGTQPTSPTHASTGGNQMFSKLPPAQVARLKPSTSATDVGNLQGQPASPSGTRDGGSSSITVNPSTLSVVQPTESPSQYVPEEPDLGLTRSTSTVTLDGEPRLFPGIVSSRNRRKSTRTSQAEDGDMTNARSRLRSGDQESVVEEKDTDEED